MMSPSTLSRTDEVMREVQEILHHQPYMHQVAGAFIGTDSVAVAASNGSINNGSSALRDVLSRLADNTIVALVADEMRLLSGRNEHDWDPIWFHLSEYFFGQVDPSRQFRHHASIYQSIANLECDAGFDFRRAGWNQPRFTGSTLADVARWVAPMMLETALERTLKAPLGTPEHPLLSTEGWLHMQSQLLQAQRAQRTQAA